MGEQCIVVRGSPVRNPGGTPIFWPLPFRGDRLETKKVARELGLTMHSTSSTLTLTVHSPTKSNKGKWRKCAKSDYVIEAGLIWERNRCPGSDTRVACHGWTVHCGAGGSPVRNPGGTPIFWPLPFRGDRLETKKGARELGLRSYVNLGKSHNLSNDSITKWRVFEPTLHWGFQTVEI